MPIFKDFVKKVVKKENARPFKVPHGIKMLLLIQLTGKEHHTMMIQL